MDKELLEIMIKLAQIIIIMLEIGFINFLAWLIILTAPVLYNRYLKWKESKKIEPQKIYLDNQENDQIPDEKQKGNDDENAAETEGVDTEKDI